MYLDITFQTQKTMLRVIGVNKKKYNFLRRGPQSCNPPPPDLPVTEKQVLADTFPKKM